MRRIVWAAWFVAGVMTNCSSSDRQFAGTPPELGGAGETGETGDGGGAGSMALPGFSGEGGETQSSSGGASAGNGIEESLAGAAQGGLGNAELAPPIGAFAWYKASEDDVVTLSASLADGNDFIKSSWQKTNVSAEALQPGVDGDMTATALSWMAIDQGDHTLTHVLKNSSYAALKTVRVRARMGQRRYLWLGGPAVSNNQPPTYAIFDLQDGTTSVGGGYVIATKMTALKSLWYECEATIVAGPEIWISISADALGSGGPTTSKPLAWIERAEVEQTVVTAWKDRIGGRDFLAASGGWGWLPTSEDFNGLPALQAYYLYGPKLLAGEGKDWTFLHDGTGGTIVLLQRQALPSKTFPHSLASEYDGANEGVHLGVSATDGKQWEFSATNASGKPVFALQGGNTTGVTWLMGSYGTEQQPQAQLFQDGTLAASTNPSIEPALTSGNLPLTLGGTYGPSQLVHELLVYKRTLSVAEVAQLTRYFSAELNQ